MNKRQKLKDEKKRLSSPSSYKLVYNKQKVLASGYVSPIRKIPKDLNGKTVTVLFVNPNIKSITLKTL